MPDSIHSDTLQPTRPTTDELCKDLMQALHTASQPLTILRASLDLTNLAGRSEEEMRRLLKQTEHEVERLCLIFGYIQQFVLVGSIDAQVATESLPDLVAHTVEGVDLLFAEAGISLTVKDIKPTSPLILLDGSRFEYALSAILLVALGVAARGDVVTVSGTPPGTTIEIAILPTSVKTMSSQTRLSMALAAANLRSQGAALTWQENPFSVQIVLPMAESPLLT